MLFVLLLHLHHLLHFVRLHFLVVGLVHVSFLVPQLPDFAGHLFVLQPQIFMLPFHLIKAFQLCP